MTRCEVQGTATAQSIDGEFARWIQADDEVHISQQLASDEAAMQIVSEMYEIGDWCPEVRAFHATKRPEAKERGL